MNAEATLAAANGIYLLLVAVGGMVYSADRLPAPFSTLVSALPSAALGQGLRDVLLDGSGLPWGQVASLLGWGGAAAWAASRTFRWR